MKEKKELNKDYNPITQGSIWKEILRYFFPILFGTLFQQLYNTADALIVGRFIGKEAIAAVAGSAGMIAILVVGFFVGLSSGATVLVSQYYGAGDWERVKRTSHTVICFGILCGLVLTIIGALTAPMILRLMNTPEDTMDMSITYLRVYSYGFLANLLFNIGSGILRAVGDSKRPTRYLMISCLLNIFLDILFIIPFRMGVFGAAFATVLSQVITGALVLYQLIRTRDCYRIQLHSLHMDYDILKEMIRIGMPAGLISVMYGLSNAIIQVGFNGISTDAVAAWAIYYKVDVIFWMGVNAFGITVATFVGQNYGAMKWDRVYKSIFTSQFMTMVFAGLCTLLVYSLGPWCIHLFVSDPGVVAVGTDMMHYLSRFYICYVTIEIFSGALRGVGDTIIPMLICAVGVCALRSGWAIWILPLRPNVFTLMFSYPLSWIITTVAFLLYFVFASPLALVGKKKRRKL